MHIWPRSTTLLRHFMMLRRTTSYSSRAAKSDGQLPRYGLRKRTAHNLASDDESHEDVSRHQNPPKKLKRTPAFSSAHMPSSRNPAKKRTKEGQGRRHTRKDEGNAWSAEAILEESDSRYLIKYEPVEESAQCEISWQAKHYANAALIAWWEERKIGSALEDGNAERDNVRDLPLEVDEASEHYNPVKSFGRRLFARHSRRRSPYTGGRVTREFVGRSLDCCSS